MGPYLKAQLIFFAEIQTSYVVKIAKIILIKNYLVDLHFLTLKFSSRAMPTDSYEFAGPGRVRVGEGPLNGHRAAVVS